MSNQKSKTYIDGEQMCELATEAAKTGEFSDELVQMFYLLAQNRWRTFRHSRSKMISTILDTDDVCQEAVILCVQKTAKFDVSRLRQKNNAFYFFKMVVDQCFIRLREHAGRQKRHPGTSIRSLDAASDNDIYILFCEEHGADASTLHTDHLSSSFASYTSDEVIDSVLDMKHKREDGQSYEDIADEYGLDEETVIELLKRQEL